MSRLIRAMNFLHWPLWLKLSAGFLVAISIPLLIVGIVVGNSFTSFQQSELEDRVAQEGREHRHTISESLEESLLDLEVIASQVQIQQQIEAGSQAERVDPSDIEVTSRLLKTILDGSNQFSTLRLVLRDGIIIGQATPFLILTKLENDQGTPAYINANTALIQNRTQTITVETDGTIEISQTLNGQDGNLLGFVIATLDQQKTILQHLSHDEARYPTHSYLVVAGQNNILIASSEVPQPLLNSTVVRRAFDGQEGTDFYESSDQTQVAGYYASIADPTQPDSILFALVTEIRTDSFSNPVLDYTSGARLFVIAVGLMGVLVLLILLFNQIITDPIVHLYQAVQSMTQGNFDQPLQMTDRADEIGQLRAAFVDMRAHVRYLLDDLEARIATRARDISTTQEVSRYAATQRNLQTLMDQVVQLIIEKFPNIYHAQIFLIDSERQNAVLRASTGQAGQTMLLRGHRLAVGSTSVIGQTTAQAKVLHVRDTQSSSVHKRNELLPETRAELAIPLRLGEQIIGALDVQSQTPNAFSEDEVSILQTMADQVSVAIENARLYQESMRRLDDLEKVNREATRRVWQDFLYSQRTRQLSSQSGPITGIDLSALRQQAIEQGKVAIGEVSERGTIPIALPIQLRGQTLGAVEWELAANDLNENKLQLAQELANRLAVSLDNARLFQESQRATERERIVNTIAAKLTPQTEISEILQTAVREVGQALRAPQVSIRLHHNNGSHHTSHNGN